MVARPQEFIRIVVGCRSAFTLDLHLSNQAREEFREDPCDKTGHAFSPASDGASPYLEGKYRDVPDRSGACASWRVYGNDVWSQRASEGGGIFQEPEITLH